MPKKFEIVTVEKRTKLSVKLMKLRKKMGVSQADLASEWNVHSGTIALWETGRRSIPGPVEKLIEIYEKNINHE